MHYFMQQLNWMVWISELPAVDAIKMVFGMHHLHMFSCCIYVFLSTRQLVTRLFYVCYFVCKLQEVLIAQQRRLYGSTPCPSVVM